jgi:hypothetical protein
MKKNIKFKFLFLLWIGDRFSSLCMKIVLYFTSGAIAIRKYLFYYHSMKINPVFVDKWISSTHGCLFKKTGDIKNMHVCIYVKWKNVCLLSMIYDVIACADDIKLRFKRVDCDSRCWKANATLLYLTFLRALTYLIYNTIFLGPVNLVCFLKTPYQLFDSFYKYLG